MYKKNRLNNFTAVLIAAALFCVTATNAQVKINKEKCCNDSLIQYCHIDSTECTIVPSTVIAPGSNWIFSMTSAAPVGWPNVTALAGSAGNAPLGFGAKEKINTFLTPRRTYYFIKNIELDPQLYHDFTVDIKVAHGAIIYINGAATASINMPLCNISYDTYAASVATEGKQSHFIVANSFFLKGKNTIQVEVHTAAVKGQTVEDMLFDVEITGNRPYVPACSVKVPSKVLQHCNCFCCCCNAKKNN